MCGLAARQKVKLGRILDQVHSDIITEREAGNAGAPNCSGYPVITHTNEDAGKRTPKPLRLLQKVEKLVPRPPTPTCPAPPPGMEEREQALILLQRVLRGRSTQAKVRLQTTRCIIHFYCLPSKPGHPNVHIYYGVKLCPYCRITLCSV